MSFGRFIVSNNVRAPCLSRQYARMHVLVGSLRDPGIQVAARILTGRLSRGTVTPISGSFVDVFVPSQPMPSCSVANLTAADLGKSGSDSSVDRSADWPLLVPPVRKGSSS